MLQHSKDESNYCQSGESSHYIIASTTPNEDFRLCNDSNKRSISVIISLSSNPGGQSVVFRGIKPVMSLESN